MKGGYAIQDTEIKKVDQFFPEIEVDFELDLSDEVIYDKVKMGVYRVVQKALKNIGKPNGANAVKIHLTTLHN